MYIDPNLPILITSIVTGIIALYGAIKSHQGNASSKANKKVSDQNKEAIEVVRQDVNGKMHELNEAKKAEGNLEGRIQQTEERKEERKEQKEQ